MKKYLIIVALIVIVAVMAFAYLSWDKSRIEAGLPMERQIPTEPVACTEEAKICPDGSAVGRQGPKCEFAECPANKAINNDGSDWQTYNDQQFKYQIQYPVGTKSRTFEEDGSLVRELDLPIGNNKATLFIAFPKSESCGRYGPGVASQKITDTISLAGRTYSVGGWVEDPRNYAKWQEDNPQYGEGSTIADYEKTINICDVSSEFSMTYRFVVKNANGDSSAVKDVELLIKKVISTFKLTK